MKKRTVLLTAAVAALCLCLFLSPAAFAEGEIAKVTVRTEPSNPIVMSSFSEVSATVSSNNGSIAGVTWLDSSGQADTDQVDQCTYTVQIRVAAPAGYIFAENVEAAVNNGACTVYRAEDGSYLDLSRTIEPALVAPTIWKSPGGETVEEGSFASFVSTASPYYTKINWNLISPEGKTSDISNITAKFPGVTYTLDDSIVRLNIHNIPMDMDGWKVSCTFTGPGGSATSASAAIKLKGAVKPTPTPSPTPEPTPEPDSGGASNEPTADTHEHQYAESWSFDDYGHWHQCSCGDKGDYAPHSFQWTELQKATKKQPGQEKGVCSDCGYESVRQLEYDKDAKGDTGVLRIILYIAAGVVLLVLILMVVQAVSDRKRRRRRRKRRYDSNSRRRY